MHGKIEGKKLTSILGVRNMNDSEQYLGNPIHFKRHKNLCFDSLMLKIKKKIQSWQANALSQAGGNIQVKSIISSLSVYNMSVLQLPKRL